MGSFCIDKGGYDAVGSTEKTELAIRYEGGLYNPESKGVMKWERFVTSDLKVKNQTDLFILFKCMKVWL